MSEEDKNDLWYSPVEKCLIQLIELRNNWPEYETELRNASLIIHEVNENFRRRFEPEFTAPEGTVSDFTPGKR